MSDVKCNDPYTCTWWQICLLGFMLGLMLACGAAPPPSNLLIQTHIDEHGIGYDPNVHRYSRDGKLWLWWSDPDQRYMLGVPEGWRVTAHKVLECRIFDFIDPEDERSFYYIKCPTWDGMVPRAILDDPNQEHVLHEMPGTARRWLRSEEEMRQQWERDEMKWGRWHRERKGDSDVIVTTRYAIGDVVYHAQALTASGREICPDCLSTKQWTAHLPNGEDVTFCCPTCTFGYETKGTVPDSSVSGRVQSLTIGSVRLDTHSGCPVEYMCYETGIGSGSVWKEDDLYDTRADAEAALPLLVEKLRVHLQESNARSTSRRRADSPGSMAAFYRAQIRRARIDITSAEEGLQREANK